MSQFNWLNSLHVKEYFNWRTLTLTLVVILKINPEPWEALYWSSLVLSQRASLLQVGWTQSSGTRTPSAAPPMTTTGTSRPPTPSFSSIRQGITSNKRNRFTKASRDLSHGDILRSTGPAQAAPWSSPPGRRAGLRATGLCSGWSTLWRGTDPRTSRAQCSGSCSDTSQGTTLSSRRSRWQSLSWPTSRRSRLAWWWSFYDSGLNQLYSRAS